MNVASVDIKDMLEADSSLGLGYAVDLFIGLEPETPDDCVTIFDTPGYPPGLTLDEVKDYYHPSVQIRIRNRKYVTAANLAHDIMVSLHGRSHETVNSTVYEVITCTGEPYLLDWDQNNRARFIINFDIERRT